MVPRSRSKFRNTKTLVTPGGLLIPLDHAAGVTGITFDSKKEATRWVELLALQKAGAIQNLQRQQRLKLRVNGVVVAIYVADYTYVENGHRVVEDVKSAFTLKDRLFRLKRKLVAACLGVEIRITGVT